MPASTDPVETLCTNCGQNPAEPGGATVALCAGCLQLAKGKERGVSRPVQPKSKNGL